MVPGEVVRPHDEEAESAFLGACLIDPDAMHRWMDGLDAEDFWLIKHGDLWRAMQGLTRRGLAADWISVRAALGEQKFAAYGDEAWLGELSMVPSALNADSYAQIVRGLAERRRILRACEVAAAAAFDKQMPLEKVRATVLTETGKALGTAARGPRHQREVVNDVLAWLEKLDRNDADVTGISTGLADLDRLTDGLFPAECTVVAGRPGMGKSAFLAGIGDAVSRKGADRRVLIFSLEMRDTIWSGRVLSSVAGVDARKLIRVGGLADDEWGRISKYAPQLAGASVWLDDRRGSSDTDIRTAARLLAGQVGGLQLIIVDHLTLIRSTRRFDAFRKEVGNVMLSMREMAKELNCHVLVAAQLNRGVEGRADKHASLSDLAESGEIEQHADAVWALYRDEYYNTATIKKGIAEIWALKSRNGMTGHVELAYDGVRQRFADLARIEQ